MGLVAKLQIMQQLTTLLTFFKIRSVYSQKYKNRASLIFSYNIIFFIIIVINCQAAFKLDHQVPQTEQLVVILKFSYLRGKCSHSNVSVHLPSELIIIDWAFIHEVYILSPLNLPRFFLTNHLSAWIGEKTFQLHKYPYSFFWIRFRYLCCSKSKNV